MNDLAILTVVALLFCVICWKGNIQSDRPLVWVVGWLGVVGSFGIASAGLIQMAARTL